MQKYAGWRGVSLFYEMHCIWKGKKFYSRGSMYRMLKSPLCFKETSLCVWWRESLKMLIYQDFLVLVLKEEEIVIPVITATCS